MHALIEAVLMLIVVKDSLFQFRNLDAVSMGTVEEGRKS